MPDLCVRIHKSSIVTWKHYANSFDTAMEKRNQTPLA
jgi:hypothetical protein